MEQFTRAERKELRRLAGLAYERELAHELTTIEAAFRAWRAGELSPFDLSDRIHAFHNGVARDLFVTYNRWDPETRYRGPSPSSCYCRARSRRRY